LVQVSIYIMATLCKDCNHLCDNLTTCLKYQDFNVLLDNHHAMVKLQKFIKMAVPDFRGKKSFLSDDPSGKFHENVFKKGINPMTWNQRFMTITFDPRKFSINELSQPKVLHKYMLNALWELRNLFSKNIILVREYHKSGIPHYHLNYSCHDIHAHMCLLLRMRYYFAKSLQNRSAMHDRMFNDGGVEYMTKSATTYFIFLPSEWHPPDNGLTISVS